MNKLLFALIILTFLGLDSCKHKPKKGNFDVQDKVITMVKVEGDTIRGSFAYNSNVFKDGETITIPSYLISKTEITQEAYHKVMKGNKDGINPFPFYFKGDTLPVESVTWYDAIYFCNRLSELSGYELSYSISNMKVDNGHITMAQVEFNKDKKGYHLPTETEWEFAARSGGYMDTYSYAGSESIKDIAWISINSENTTHEAALKEPNLLGLYDMSGNVWEWLWDSYLESVEDAPDTDNTSYRLIKGGGIYNYASYATLTSSLINMAGNHRSDLGFRITRHN